MRLEQETVTAEFQKVLALPKNGIPENVRKSMLDLFEWWHAILITQTEIKASELQRRVDPPLGQRVTYDRAWALYFTLILNMGWASFSHDGVLKRLM